jgi:DNA-binding NarL/FixJ family response regulator
MVLTQAGCCVSQAGSIEEMFASVESSQPDAILMDYHIHGETSLAALSVLKGRAETRDIPIGIISGRHDSALVEMAMKAGALLCIPKPIGIDELVCIVSQMREGGRHGALAVPLGQSCGQNGTAS